VIALVVSAIFQAAMLSGDLPSQVEPASVTRVQWVPANDVEGTALQQADCALRPPRGWSCRERSPGEAGIVVVHIGADIGFVALGPHGIVATVVRAKPAADARQHGVQADAAGACVRRTLLQSGRAAHGRVQFPIAARHRGARREREGVLRHFAARRDGMPRDNFMYSIFAHEWPDVRRHLELRLKKHAAAVV
jgi:hypothetical protein